MDTQIRSVPSKRELKDWLERFPHVNPRKSRATALNNASTDDTDSDTDTSDTGTGTDTTMSDNDNRTPSPRPIAKKAEKKDTLMSIATSAAPINNGPATSTLRAPSAGTHFDKPVASGDDNDLSFVTDDMEQCKYPVSLASVDEPTYWEDLCLPKIRTQTDTLVNLETYTGETIFSFGNTGQLYFPRHPVVMLCAANQL